MNHSNTNTAILLFARTANAEIQEKNFLHNSALKANRKVSERLFVEAHQTCVSAGLPVFHIDENRQKGSNFAERLQSSFQHVFEQGYDNVIAVGNDCPLLSVHDIKRAEESIKEGKAILGETHKGGIYLIGVNKTQFQKIDLDNINWGSKKVFRELFNTLSKNSNLSLLRRKTEYNNEEDLAEATCHLNNKLYRWLLSQAAHKEPKMDELVSILSFDFESSNDHRGPPLK